VRREIPEGLTQKSTSAEKCFTVWHSRLGNLLWRIPPGIEAPFRDAQDGLWWAALVFKFRNREFCAVISEWEPACGCTALCCSKDVRTAVVAVISLAFGGPLHYPLIFL